MASSSSSAGLLLLVPILLLAATILPYGLACLCKVETPEHNYCAADWVAHVLVVNRQERVRMPAGIVDRQIEQNARYHVNYKEMFKISDRMNVTEKNLVVLPINVYSPMEDAACGITLEPGHEYLLAGQYVNQTMMTRLCGQLLLEDLKEARKHDVLEWAEVPEKIKGHLFKQEFEPACKKEAQAAASKNGTAAH